MMQEQDQTNQLQQYENWKLNSPFLYDRLVVTNLSYPSVSFTWLPQKIQTQSSIIYKYVYSTNSGGQEQQQYLYFAEVELSCMQMQFPKLRKWNQQTTQILPKNRIYHQIVHPGQPNRIVRHPANPKEVATKTIEGNINIYKQGTNAPLQVLKGNTQQGYAIDWKTHGLVTGAYDGRVFVWKDVYDAGSSPTFSGKYQDKIQDTKWFDQNVFLAVSDDGYMSIWDTRAYNNIVRYQWHNSELNTIDVNPFQKQLVIAGAENGLVKLWDLRSPIEDLHPFDGHSDSVVRVEWSPNSHSLFSSGSVDSKVNIWDILKVGVQVDSHQTSQISNQLIFTHRGHRGAVSDLNWNPFEDILGSVEQQFNTMQFYQIPFLFKNAPDADFEYQKMQILV